MIKRLLIHFGIDFIKGKFTESVSTNLLEKLRVKFLDKKGLTCQSLLKDGT